MHPDESTRRIRGVDGEPMEKVRERTAVQHEGWHVQEGINNCILRPLCYLLTVPKNEAIIANATIPRLEGGL